MYMVGPTKSLTIFLFPLQFLYIFLSLIQPLALSHLTILKLAGINTSLTLTPTAHLLQYLLQSVFLKPPTHTFITLFKDPGTFAISFGSINLPVKACWFPEIVQEWKAFVRVHCSQENRQNYISISSCTSTVISKAKADSW